MKICEQMHFTFMTIVKDGIAHMYFLSNIWLVEISCKIPKTFRRICSQDVVVVIASSHILVEAWVRINVAIQKFIPYVEGFLHFILFDQINCRITILIYLLQLLVVNHTEIVEQTRVTFHLVNRVDPPIPYRKSF